jgi:hypothetical protein
MAFTNVYDDTFPPDVQLASQGAADLRQVRLDVQERMAAISGLDAAKPNFAGDTQPVKWNGILFFATDTGKIYQFNNPSWTDVTNSFRFTTTAIFKSNPFVTHTGTTTVDTIWSFTMPVLALTNIVRIRYAGHSITQGAGTTIIGLINGSAAQVNMNSNSGNFFVLDQTIAPVSNTTANNIGDVAANPFATSPPVGGSSLINIPNITAPQTWNIQVQSANNADSQILGPILVEIL